MADAKTHTFDPAKLKAATAKLRLALKQAEVNLPKADDESIYTFAALSEKAVQYPTREFVQV